MKYQRVWALAKLRISKIIENYHLPLIGLLFGIFITTFPVAWNQEHVTFFQLQWGTSEEDLLSLLHELFSWVWLFAVLPYFLRGLLQPLGDSSLVSQMLWLRFTSCLPLEVALARAIWVIGWGLWLGTLGFLWASVTFLFHHFFYHLPVTTFPKLLLNVEGLVSHVLLSGGIVAALASSLPVDDYSGRRLVSTVASFIPLMLTPIYIALRRVKYAVFFPYTLPFAKTVAIDSETILHFGMATLIGILLLSTHIVTTFGSAIQNKIIEENERI